MKDGERAAGLEAIILYKLAKSIFELLVSALALTLLWQGAEASAATLAQVLLDHVTRAWALQLATFIVIAGTAGHVKIAAIAALGDAILSVVEGLSLRAGVWWAPWLVVVATGSLLPYELLEVVRRPGLARVVILVLNLAVVVYLLASVVREQRQKQRLPQHASKVDRQTSGP